MTISSNAFLREYFRIIKTRKHPPLKIVLGIMDKEFGIVIYIKVLHR